MKRHLLLTFLLLMVGLLPAVAEEVVFTDFGSGWKPALTSTASTSETTMIKDGLSLVHYQCKRQANGSVVALFLTKTKGYVKLPAFDKKVESITLKSNNGASKSAVVSISGSTSLGTLALNTVDAITEYTLTIPEEKQETGVEYKIQATSDANVQISYIKVVLKDEEEEPTAPEPPVFTPGAGRVLVGTPVTITSKGADIIEYSFDGVNFTNYEEPVTINEACTLYAKGIKDIDESEVASAEYTVAYGGKVTFNTTDYAYKAETKALDWVSDDGQWILPTTVVAYDEESDLPKVVTTTKGLRIYGTYNNVITVNAPKGYRFQAVDYAVATPKYDIAIDGEVCANQTKSFDNPTKSFEIASATDGYAELTYLNFELVEYPDDLEGPACATPVMNPDQTEFKVGESIEIVCATDESTMNVSINDKIFACKSSKFPYTFGNEGTYVIKAVASAPDHVDSEEFNATVIVRPVLPEFYLRGSMNGSNWDALPEYKFALENYDKTEKGEYVYSLAMPVSFKDGDEFKVANSDWTHAYGGKNDPEWQHTFYASDEEWTREGLRNNGENYRINGDIFRPTVYFYYSPEDWKSSWVRVVRGTVPSVGVDVESGSTVKSGSTVTVTVPGAESITVTEKSITGHDVAPMTFEGETAELPVSRLHRYYTVKGSVDGFDTEAAELVYNIEKAPEPTTYQLVTSADQLKDGMVVLIGTSAPYVMSKVQSNNIKAAAIPDGGRSDDGAVISALPDPVFLMTLEKLSDGNWGFKGEDNGIKYFYNTSTSGSNNYFKSSTTPVGATVEIAESGDATIVFQGGHSSRNQLRYNSQSTLFACYSSGQAAVRLYAEVKVEAGTFDNTPAMHVYLTRHTESESGGDDDNPVLEAGAIDGGTEVNRLEAVSTDEDGTITFRSIVSGNYTGKFHYVVSDPETGEETVIGGHPDDVVNFHSDENGTCTDDHADLTKYVYVDPAADTEPVTMVADSNVPFSFDPNAAHGVITKTVNPEFTVSMKPFEAVTTSAVGGADTTSVGNVAVDAMNGDVEFYNLNGVRISAGALTPGIYVRRQGSTATRVVIR